MVRRGRPVRLVGPSAYAGACWPERRGEHAVMMEKQRDNAREGSDRAANDGRARELDNPVCQSGGMNRQSHAPFRHEKSRLEARSSGPVRAASLPCFVLTEAASSALHWTDLVMIDHASLPDLPLSCQRIDYSAS